MKHIDKSSDERAVLVHALRRNMRMLVRSFTKADALLAKTIGIHSTDLASIDLLRSSEEPVTPKQLATYLGISTGSATAAIDRLEKAGFVERVHNQRDRRGIFIQPVPGRIEEIAKAHDSINFHFDALAGRFSDDELRVVNKFLSSI
jgi:DNA-binding MarR family transcriptional regulator